MTAATEKELSTLHKRVADVLLKKLKSSDTAGALLAEFSEDLPDEVKEYLEDQIDVSPALLTVITKFLKDNEITAVVEESSTLSELDKRLEEKRRRRVSSVVPITTDE